MIGLFVVLVAPQISTPARENRSSSGGVGTTQGKSGNDACKLFGSGKDVGGGRTRPAPPIQRPIVASCRSTKEFSYRWRSGFPVMAPSRRPEESFEKAKAAFGVLAWRPEGTAAQPPRAGTPGNRPDGQLLCRFSDACMTKPSTRANSRRPKSAGARNRGVQGTSGAATYQRAMGDLKSTPVAASAQHSGTSG